MLTFKTNSNVFLQVPSYIAPLFRQKTIFHLGIDFLHFYQIYLSRSTNIYLSIETIVNALRSYNIEPFFVFSGITYQEIDCIHLNLQNSVKDFLNKINVSSTYSPSTANAQLSKLYQLKCINAILCSPTIVLRDISRWVHFIDFKARKIIMLRGNLKLMKDILSTRSICEVAAPSFSFEKVCWDIKPPLSELKLTKVPDIVIGLISIGAIQSPSMATYPQNSSKRPLFQLPRNCLNYLNILCGIYFSLFIHLTKLPYTRFLSVQDAPPYDEFLPLLLSQKRISEPCELNDSLFSQILAQQNISSTRFTTLLDCLKSVSAPQKISSQKQITPEYVISEGVRRFLTAHEYIAPGGELSPWGRAILVANNGLDITTIMFIELIRADVMDSDFNSNFGGIGVIDIIERIFSLFPTITQLPQEMINKEKVESQKFKNTENNGNNVNDLSINKNSFYLSPHNFPSTSEIPKISQPPPPQLPPSPLFDMDKNQNNNQMNSNSMNSQLITANKVISLHQSNQSQSENFYNNYDNNTNYSNNNRNSSNGTNNSSSNDYGNYSNNNNSNNNNNFDINNPNEMKNSRKSDATENVQNNSDCHNNSNFYTQTFHVISHMLFLLFRIIICDTYISISKKPDLAELKNILSKIPFQEFPEHSTGILMRFLLESSDEKRKAFVKSVPREQLKKDVYNAFNWWKSLNKATVELKQRSLMPNSRVSNLKNFLVMFECANHFVEKTIVDVFKIL